MESIPEVLYSTTHCHSIFLTKVSSPAEIAPARLLIESIQAFGGEMSGCPIWVFATDPESEDCRLLASDQVSVMPAATPRSVQGYPFASKVFACAQAESMAPARVQSLVWIDPECLIVQPPRLYALGEDCDLALRPVHLRNVGLPAGEPLDPFWEGIYAGVGTRDIHRTVKSFIDGERLRAYYNSHAFSLRPGLGLLRRWYNLFERLVNDPHFQARACREPRQRIFLFQALLSALVASSINEQRVRILPPTYNYPYNLQGQVGEDRRAGVLNELVSLTFEGRCIHPDSVTDIEIREPLRSWLEARAPAQKN